MKKLVILGIAVVALLAFSVPVWGGYIFEDPLFKVGEREVQVEVIMITPGEETVSKTTTVTMLVPRNLPAEVIDPLGCKARIRRIAPQDGPPFISLVQVKVPRKTDEGSMYTFSVEVRDDRGFKTTTPPSPSDQAIVVSYIQR